MRYLVDTNVISELTKPKACKAVVTWITGIPETELFLSVISIGEIVLGINKLSDEVRKTKLSIWLDSVISIGFDNRIFSIDIEIMRVWGKMYASLSRSLSVQDTLIAATALAKNLIIATRNVKDFEDIAGLSVFNPWEAER
jgi:predicted nucleic acid-binding protein